MDEYTTIIDGLRIHYFTAGDKSSPVIVFLHARGASIDGFNNMRNVVKELSQYFYVVAPEHPGLIRSETPIYPQNYLGYAQLLNKLLSKLAVKRFVIVGNSFGGGVGTEFVKLYPNEVQKLVLVDSVLNGDYKQTEKVTSIDKNLLFILKSKYIPFWAKKLAIWSHLGTPLSYISKEDLKRKINWIQANWEVDVDYSKLKVPVVLLWGKKDTKIHPIKYAREIVKKNPRIKLIEYDGNIATIYKEPTKITNLIKEAVK